MHQLERKYVYCHPLCGDILKQMSSIVVNMWHPSIINKKINLITNNIGVLYYIEPPHVVLYCTYLPTYLPTF
jgi:hypothetical protein